MRLACQADAGPAKRLDSPGRLARSGNLRLDRLHSQPRPFPTSTRPSGSEVRSGHRLGGARWPARTPHGSVETPAFMPVGTQATVKGLTPDQLRATGTQMILANTYHLALRPGEEVVARSGGFTHSWIGTGRS